MYIFILALLGCLGCSLFVITCLRFVDFVYYYAQSQLSLRNALSSFLRDLGAEKQRL